MAPVRNTIEERRARPRFESTRPRSTATSAPLLLRLPRIRVDQGKSTEKSDRFVATAEAENSIDPIVKTSAAITGEQQAESQFLRPQDRTQDNADEVSTSVKQLGSRSWLDDWTNGVIIFLVTVVVVTTLLLVIQSPTFRQSKWFRGLVEEQKNGASSEFLVEQKQVASQEASRVAESATASDPSSSDSNSTTSQTVQTPLDGPKPLLIEGISTKVEAIPSSARTQSNPAARALSTGTDLEDADFQFGEIPHDPPAGSSTSGDLEARRNPPAPTASERTAAVSPSTSQRRITETEYAESNVEQLLQLLKQQRGQAGETINGQAPGFAQASPMMNSTSGVPARMASVPTGPMGVPGGWSPPNGTMTNIPNAVNGWGQSGPTGQPNSGFATPPAPQTPYESMLPSLLEEMPFGGPDDMYSPPPAYQPVAPAFNPPPGFNQMPQGYGQPPYR